MPDNPSKNLFESQHPQMLARLAVLRDKNTTVPAFRQALFDCGAFLAYEMTSDLPVKPVTVQTPLEAASVKVPAQGITCVAILRASLGMVDGMSRTLPEARIGHLGLYRDEESLQPVRYYGKLPAGIKDDLVLLADPMLATGGSIIAGLRELENAGCQGNIRVAALIAAPEGVAAVHKHFPDLQIYVAALDRQLNDIGYIMPGLGDAGDRQYGTF